MAKVLIIGVDTMIGANCALVFGQNHDCVGLYSRCAVEPLGCQSQACELSCPVSVLGAIQNARPDWIVYCGDSARSAWEAAAECRDETEVVRVIADEASHEHIPLTVISTDGVYSGPRLFHEETWSATAQTRLAVRARAIEEVLAGTPALVVRTHAYGWSADPDEPSFAEVLFQQLRDDRIVAVDGLRYATPILASDLAELLVRAYETDLKGLYHITGAERVNPDRFVRELAIAMSRENVRQPAPSTTEPLSRVGATETSLNTRRARRDLGRPMPLLREGLERFVAQAESDYLAGLRLGTRVADLKTVAA
jgi:dTDP-4-dehydrorhamnose reductase